MYLIIEDLEVIRISDTPDPVLFSVYVSNDYKAWGRTVHLINGETIICYGKIFTTAELAQLQTIGLEKLERLERINNELSALIGLNVLTLTDVQRWKLVAAVFYKLGVINSSGIINPYSDWFDI